MLVYVTRSLARLAPVLGAAFLVFAPSLSFAHANLISPPPRDSSTGIKDPAGPCGPTPRGTTPVAYQTGQTVTVKWQETIYHPGCYLIDFSPANDQNWQTLLTLPHDAATTAPINYTAQVTLPQGVTCPACTLRVRQIMLAVQGTCPPSPITAGQTYYSCGDIAISDSPSTDMAAPPGADLAGTTPPAPDAGGGGGGSATATGCQAMPVGAGAGPLSSLALLGLAAVALRRRRFV